MYKPLSVLLASSLALASCEKCEGPPNAYETGITLQLLSAIDDNPLFRPATGYSLDSLQLVNQDGVALPFLVSSFPRSSEINFPLLQAADNSSTVSQRLSQTYFLRFSNTDQDTIHSEYMLVKNECNKPEFSTLKVSYNGRLLYEGGHSYGVEAIIRKP